MREKDKPREKVDIFTLGHEEHPKDTLMTAISEILMGGSIFQKEEVEPNKKSQDSIKRSKSLYLHKK